MRCRSPGFRQALGIQVGLPLSSRASGICQLHWKWGNLSHFLKAPFEGSRALHLRLWGLFMLWQGDDCLAPCSISLLLGNASEYAQPGCHHPGATTFFPLFKKRRVAFTQNKLILIYLPHSCQSLKFHSVGVSNPTPPHPQMWRHLQFAIRQQQWTGCYSLLPFSYEQQLQTNSVRVQMHLLAIVTLESWAREI